MTHEEKQIHNAVHVKLQEFDDFVSLVKKMREAQKGRKLSEERCKQLSLAKIGKYRGKDNPNAKPIKQYTKGGEFIRDWSCTAEAARMLGVNAGSIYNCLAKRFKTGGGFVWEWLHEK